VTEKVVLPITRRQMLLITMASAFIVYLIWNVSLFSWFAYPLRLFVTYVHESGHALAAIISGGEVVKFTVSSNGSGLATTIGGSRALILPAGYLGAALFGSLLFYTINRFPGMIKGLSTVLGAALVVFTFLYARPDDGGSAAAIFIGFLIGGLLVVIGLRGSRMLNLLILSVLAIATGLNAVLDITGLVSHADLCMRTASGQVCNDAAAFQQQITPAIPAAFIAGIWALMAIGMVVAAVYYSVVRQWLRQAEPQSETATTTIRNEKKSNDPLKGLKRDADGNIDWSQF